MNSRQIIRLLIDKYHFTQSELARVAKLTPGRISHIYTSSDEKPASCSFEAGKRLEDLLNRVRIENGDVLH